MFIVGPFVIVGFSRKGGGCLGGKLTVRLLYQKKAIINSFSNSAHTKNIGRMAGESLNRKPSSSPPQKPEVHIFLMDG